jgi:hypothetical protein
MARGERQAGLHFRLYSLTGFAPNITGFTIAEHIPFCYKGALRKQEWMVSMNASEIQIQRAISAALRKLNTGATFSADIRTTSTHRATDRNVNRESCYLRQTIELILKEFEYEERITKM